LAHPHMTTTPTLIAEAIHELEAYDDTEHRAVLALVRELFDLDSGNASDVHSARPQGTV
jgi:hypothetical protein